MRGRQGGEGARGGMPGGGAGGCRKRLRAEAGRRGPCELALRAECVPAGAQEAVPTAGRPAGSERGRAAGPLEGLELRGGERRGAGQGPIRPTFPAPVQPCPWGVRCALQGEERPGCLLASRLYRCWEAGQGTGRRRRFRGKVRVSLWILHGFGSRPRRSACLGCERERSRPDPWKPARKQEGA